MSVLLAIPEPTGGSFGGAGNTIQKEKAWYTNAKVKETGTITDLLFKTSGTTNSGTQVRVAVCKTTGAAGEPGALIGSEGFLSNGGTKWGLNTTYTVTGLSSAVTAGEWISLVVISLDGTLNPGSGSTIETTKSKSGKNKTPTEVTEVAKVTLWKPETESGLAFEGFGVAEGGNPVMLV